MTRTVGTPSFQRHFFSDGRVIGRLYRKHLVKRSWLTVDIQQWSVPEPARLSQLRIKVDKCAESLSLRALSIDNRVLVGFESGSLMLQPRCRISASDSLFELP